MNKAMVTGIVGFGAGAAIGYVTRELISDKPQFIGYAQRITMDEYFPVDQWQLMNMTYLGSRCTSEGRVEVYAFESKLLPGNVEAIMQVWYDKQTRFSWMAEVSRQGMLSMRIFLNGVQVDVKPDYSTWPGINVGDEYASQIGYINIKIPPLPVPV